MTDANYIRHFKALGKFAAFFDEAVSAVSAEEILLANTADQIATGDPDDNPSVILFAAFASSLQAAITSGPSGIQNLAKQVAGQYVQQALFTSGLTTVPASASVAAIMTALATEMTDVDNKTLGTKTTTGLVNFFDAITGTSGSWNTESDTTADYKDSVYAISAIV